MKNFLPSRGVVAFVLVPAITIFLVWAILTVEKNTKTKVKNEKTFVSTLEEGRLSVRNVDTDGDGLKDWEETLYGTDPDVIDTDGDGMSDGAEVNNNRDPLSAGEEEGEENEIETAQNDTFVFYKDDPTLTKTDVLARDILNTYSQLKNSNSLGSDIADRAIDDTINENIVLETLNPYNTDNVTKIFNTPANKNQYERNYDASSNVLRSVNFHELELLARWVELGDQESYLELQKNRKSYQAFVDSLAKLSVPENIVQVHVELLNNLSSMIFTIDQMLLAEEDPLSSLLYAEKFINDENVTTKTIEALSLYFTTD